VVSESVVAISKKLKPAESSEIILQELKGLRHDLEARLGVKFSDRGFTESDAFSFFFAVDNALNRFDTESTQDKGDVDDLLTEARGHVAIVGLVLSWAEANQREGIKRQAKELLARAESTLQRIKEL